MTTYLSVDQINFIHSKSIEKFGGIYGTRDYGLVEASAARPQMTFGGKDLYRDIYMKAAVLGHSICCNHPYIDGNKRTAFACMDIFLQENGLVIKANDDDAEEMILSIIHKSLDEKGLTHWLEQNTQLLKP